MSPSETPILLIPVYDDWDVAELLLQSLARELRAAGRRAAVVFVDDGSNREWRDVLRVPDPATVVSVEVLELRRNLGHQGAISIGLAWIHEHRRGRPVVVMDGDGEDAPSDVLRLLDRLTANDGRRIVFAARKRRSESLRFRFFYLLYVILHRILTGRGIRFGNFSAIPPSALDRLVTVPQLGVHFAAAAVHARLDHETLDTVRHARLGGRSTMSFTSLVIHGLSALSVYGPLIGARLTIVTAGLCTFAGLACLGLFATSALDLTSGTGLLAVILVLATLVQLLLSSTLFVIMVLGARLHAAFLPERDYRHFVAGVHRLEPGS